MSGSGATGCRPLLYSYQRSSLGILESSAITHSDRGDSPTADPICRGGNMVSPLWMSFTVSQQDRRIATCNTCGARFTRLGKRSRSFYTMNMINHLRSLHCVEIWKEHQKEVRTELLCWRKESFEQRTFALQNSNSFIGLEQYPPPHPPKKYESKQNIYKDRKQESVTRFNIIIYSFLWK